MLRRLPGRGRESGQAVVEFSLVLVMFLVLIFAIIDFGLGLHANIETANAAREGARKGAVWGSVADIQQRVNDTAGSLVSASISSIDVTFVDEDGDGNIRAGDSVKVVVSCSYNFITPVSPLVALMSGGSLTPSLPCNATAVMRLE